MDKKSENIERFELRAYVSVCAQFHMTNEFSNQMLWSIEFAICLCLVGFRVCVCIFFLLFTIATIVMYYAFPFIGRFFSNFFEFVARHNFSRPNQRNIG